MSLMTEELEVKLIRVYEKTRRRINRLGSREENIPDIVERIVADYERRHKVNEI